MRTVPAQGGMAGSLQRTHVASESLAADADRFARLVQEFKDSEYFRRTTAMLKSVRG